MRNLKQTSFVLHKPVIIAQAEPGQRAWGYHQFPEIEKLSDGRLHVRYHISPDSARSYGLGKGHAISDDDGLTWTETANEPVNGGILLSNGDSLRIKHLPSVPLDQVMIDRLPRYQTENYGISVDIYDTDCFPEKMNGWPLERRPAGSMKWILEMKTIDFPGDVRHTCEDVLPWRMFWRLRQAPDKAVWAIAYTYVFMDDHSVSITPLFFRSNDDGCSFHFVSMIPYVSDPTADSKAALRCGFTEPDITFLPNGDLFCLLRTTDGNGIGPLYACHSTDAGKTWSKPVYFDDIGVWPTLLTLGCGTTVASYGRPGLFVRASTKLDASKWARRQTIVQAGAFQTDTCSYSDIIALSDNSLLLVYSDFNYPNAAGVPVKTILGRKVVLTDQPAV